MKKTDNLLGEVVSRTTMAIVALAMLFGGYKCLSVANGIRQEYVHSPTYDNHHPNYDYGNSSGAGLPAMIGIGLLVVGGFFLLAAIFPVGMLTRFINPPRASLYDNAAEDQASGVSSIFRFFGRL